MSNGEKQKNGNFLATVSAVVGIAGLVLSLMVIGIPVSILAIILARKALAIGNFGTYKDDRTTMSYSFRANTGLVTGIIGCVIGFGILFVGVLSAF